MGVLLDEARQKLAGSGGRMTAQRRLVLEMLDGMTDHPTAEALYERIRQRAPDINLSTVYRTLRWLEGEGLVSARRFDDRRGERFDPETSAEHHHFVCTACKQVVEFSSPLIDALRAEFESERGVCVETASVVLYGRCRKCLDLPVSTK